MIFTAERGDLAAGIARAAQGLPSHPAQPVYAGLLIESDMDSDLLRATASDGEVTLTSFARGTAEAWGRHIIPGRLLSDITRYLAGDKVRLEIAENKLEITSGKSSFTLPALPGDQYPGWQAPPPPVVQLSGEDFAAAIRAVSPSAGDDTAVLTAICMEFEDPFIKLVTTDHSRMALAEIPVDLIALRETGVVAESIPAALVPAKGAAVFARNCTGWTGVGWNDALVMMQYEDAQMIVRQVQGTFLPWRNILKKEPPYKDVAADVKELTRAVRMAQLAAGPDNRIALTFGEGEIAVTAGREGRGCTEYVPVTYTGEPVTFLLGAQNVLDGLAGCDDTAEVAFTVPPAPLFLRSGNFRYMMQPRREL